MKAGGAGVMKNLSWWRDRPGEELYLIPGIDMINHAVLPAERSTSLQMAQETLTVACGPQGDPITFTGFFTMKAGAKVLSLYDLRFSIQKPVPDPCQEPKQGPFNSEAGGLKQISFFV